MSRSPRQRRPLIEALEPRLLFSATADIAVFDDGASDGQYLAQAADELDLISIYMPAEPVMMDSQANDVDPQADLRLSESPAITTLIFVDTAVENYETLVDDIRARVDADAVAIVYLDSAKDGLGQINDYLAGVSGISAVHVISHGIAGNLQLGNLVLNEGNIHQFASQLSGWQAALGEDADILLYGCDLASNASGLNLLRQLSDLTGADIAASNDLTGSGRAGADWDLEEKVGAVETASIFSSDQSMQWQGVLADVVRLYSGVATNEQAIPTGGTVMQGIQLTSSNTIDRIQVMLANHGTSATSVQMIIHQTNYNGPVVATASVATSSLGGSLGWANFDFSQITLNAYGVYWVEFKTNNGADNLVGIGYINSNVIASEFVVNSSGDSLKDMAIAVIDQNVTNQAPVVSTAITNQQALKGVGYSYQFASNAFTDPDGHALTYSATQHDGSALPAWLSFNAGTRTFSGTPPDAYAVDTFVIRVTANDGNGGTVSDDFVLTVSNKIEAETYNNSSGVITEATTDTGGGQNVGSLDGGDWVSYFWGSGSQIVGNSGQYTIDWRVASNTGGSFGFTNENGSIVYDTVVVPNTGGWQNWVTISHTVDVVQQWNYSINAYSGNPNINWFQLTPNDTPVVVRGLADQTASEDYSFTYQFSNTQGSNIFEDSDTLAYSATLVGGGALPAWLTFDAGTRTFSGTPANGDVNTINVRVTATDTYGANSYDDFSITVANTNDAPTVANAIPNQTATEESLFNFQFAANTFNDVDPGATLTYSATKADGNPLPAWLSFNAGTRTFSGVPDDGDVGTISIKVTASDGNGGSVEDTFDLAVTNINDLPFVNFPVPNQNATEDSAFSYSFPGNTFGDGDLSVSFTYTAELAGGGALPAWLNFDSATRTFSGTPANGDVGTISVKLIANDGAGATVSDTFDLVIANANDAPVLANPISNQTATENALFNFSYAINTFNDPDVGDSLTYTAQLAGGGALPAWLSFDGATRTFSGTPSNGDVGTLNIQVIATDGSAASVSDFFDLTVQNVGSSNLTYETSGPAGNTQTLSAGVPLYQSFFHDSVGPTYTVDSIILQLVKDPAASAQTITVSLIAGTYNGAVVASSTVSSADIGTTIGWKAFTFADEALDDNQLYFIKVETSSADGLVRAGIHNTDVYPNGSFHSSFGVADTSRDLAFQVASGSNTNPVLVNPIANQNATEDAAYSFQFAANVFNDVDVGDTLTYSATMADGSALPGWLGFDSLTRTFSGTPLNGDVGTISVRVTADDSHGGTLASDTFDLTIANTNDAPTVANLVPNQNANEDQAFNFTFAASTFADQDVGNTLTYSAQLAGGGALPAWLSFDSATRTFSGTPLNAHVGSVAIDVIASDGNGGTVTDTFTILVANTNDAPVVANPIANQNATEDAAYNFQFPLNTFSDPDVGDVLTYSAQLAGGAALPAWLSFDAATRTFSGTPANGDVGNFSVELIASDGNGGTVTDYFDIEVTNVNDAPTVVISPTDYYADEQVSINLHGTGIVVADDDGDALTVTLTGTGSNSNLAATVGTTGVVIVSGVNTNTLILSGTAAQLNNLFAGNDGSTLTYRLSGDTPAATRLLTISASDGSLSGNDTAIINITAVNDGPENDVPGAQATDEDTALVFSAGNGNQIQVDDLDVVAGDLEVTLSVTNGTLTLAGVAGLVFTTGDGTADSSLVFRGTQANINAALATLTFNPTANFNGAAVLSITTSDLGNTGTGGTLTDSDNINITVNAAIDAPTIANAIANQNATEDAAFNFQFAANTFADPDVGDTLTYTAQLAGGGALPAWLSFDPVTRTFSGTPLNAHVGTVSIDVIADDGNGGTVTDTFDIVVANTNDAPTIANAIANQNATEDAAFNFQFAANTFADTDVGDTLTYTAQLAGGGALPAWLSFDPVTRTFSGTPANGDVGTVAIDVIADDGNGGTVTDTFDIVVANSNDAPTVANAIPNQNATEDAAFNFQFAANTFADVDAATTLTYTAQLAGGGALPAWLSFDPVTRTFSGTPTNAFVGTVSIDVIADDGNGGTVTDTFDIVVANSNDAPTIANAIPNQNATEDAAFNFQFAANTFADVDPATTLTYTAQLSGGGALPAWLSFDPVTRTFSGTPLNAHVGTVSIDVIADDGNGGTVTDTFDIVVANSNDAPTVANAIPNQNATEDAAFNFQFAANTFADVDAATTLTYSAQLAGGGALPAWLSFDPVTRTFSGTPLNAHVGTVSIDVIADDGNGGTVTDTFDIVVANTNDAPTIANAIPNQNATEDAAFNFQFAANTFADVDPAAALTYSAQLAGGGALPAWLSFDPVTRTFSGTPLNAHVGTVSIDVIADDGNGGTVTDTFNIVVANTNDAPTIANAIANQNATEDAPFNFQFAANTFADVDAATTLTYSAQLAGGGALPAWLSFDPVTRTFSGTPLNAHVGTVSIDVIADDGNGGTVTDTFDIVVANTNDAPTIANAIANQNATEDAAFNFQFAANTFADVDAATTLTYSAQLAGGSALPAWLSFDPVTRTFSGTPTNAFVGTVSIDVIADDGNGGTVTDTFDIVVANTNDAPTVANAIPDRNATENSSFNFQFAANTFADVDVGATLTYAAQLNGGGALPAWLSFDPVTRTFSGTPANSDVGTVSIDVIADDGNGGTVTDTFDLVVSAGINNLPTVANAIPNQNATEDAAFNFQFAANTFNDADVGNILTYTAQLAGGASLPTWLSFDSATRTFSGVPLNANVGTISVEVIADDGNGGTVTDTFDIVVANTNDAPTIANAIANQNATEDAAFNFQFAANTFADIDPATTLTYTAQLAGGGALPTWLSFDPVTRTFSGTPLNAHIGTVSIDVIADDGNGGTVTDTFDIVVANSNDAPTIANAIPNQNATEDAAFNFQFAANTFADVDAAATLTYTAQLAGGGALPAWLSFDPVTRTFSGTPLNAHVGTVSIDVIADDGNGGTVTDTFDIVVANTNDAPTIANAIANQNATEDAAFNFQFAANTFADVDPATTLTYTAQLAGGGALPAWLSFDAVTRTFSGTPLNAHVGTVSIDVIADDGNGGTVTDTFDIVVANTNDAPTIANAIANQNATENAAYTFQFATNVFADIDVGDTLTFTAQLAGGGALPAWLSFDPVTRTFSGTPANSDVGTVSIDVIADDGNGGTVTDTFNIVVGNFNDAPTVANAIADQNATEDAAFNFQFAANTFADTDVGDTLTYTAQLAGGGALPAWLSFDAVTRTFSGTPLNAHVGTVSIDVIADDGNGGTVTDTFDIVVANTNDAPTIANPIPDQNATENSAFTFQFAANTFNDQDVGNLVTYTAQLTGGGPLPAWLSFDAVSRTFSGTPGSANIGSVAIDVIANDGNGGSVVDSFDLVISAQAANLPPVVQAGVGDQVVAEDSRFSFTIPSSAFSDAEGDALNYSAQLAGGGALPSWLSFDAATRTFSGTPLNDDLGVLDVQVTVSDGGGSTSDTFTITVTNTNDAPVASIQPGNVSAQEDSPFTFSLPTNTFSDVDAGDVLTYSALLANGDALPSWLRFDADTLTLSGTPGGGDVGVLSIQVLASDGEANAFVSVNLSVIPLNDAPVTSGLAQINNLEDAAGDVVDLLNAFSDEETPSNGLQYSVVSNNNPSLVSSAVIDPVTGKLQLSYGANQFGSADLIIRAQDAQGASVETSLRVNIESVNDTPVSTGIADVRVQAGAEPQQMNLQNVFSDIEDGTQLKYTVMGNSNPAVATNVQLDPATGMMTVTFSSNTGGESIVTLRSLDAEGAWVETQFKVAVTAAVVPPVEPPLEPPVTPTEPGTPPPTLPPTTPPTEPPTAEIPVTKPPVEGGNQVIDPLVPTTPGDMIDTNVPSTGGSGNPVIHDNGSGDFTSLHDRSSRDYERAAEMLNSGNASLITLTASTSLVSLIAPDAGFAPWEVADFDNEVRRVRAQMDEALEEEHDRKAVVAGLTFSVTTGLLVWSLRASSLLLTMMSMLPLWRGLDPLPILDEVNKKKKELEQQRKDREREDKSAKEVGYLFDHAQRKESRP